MRNLARPAAALAAGVLGALVALAGVPAAQAAEDTGDGTWWHSGMAVDEVHAQGATGQGVTVAVIDMGINASLPIFDGADVRVREPSYCVDAAGAPLPASTTAVTQDARHGTNVTAFVAGQATGDGSLTGVAPDATVLVYVISDGTDAVDGHCDLERTEDGVSYADGMAQAVRQAVDDGAQIITISIAGAMHYDADVQDAIAWALHEGVIVISGLGEYQSRRSDFVKDDLGLLNGVVAVEACDATLQPIEGEPGSGVPMKHGKVTVCAPGDRLRTVGSPTTGNWSEVLLGSGTSYAAPLTAGALAAVWSAYPQATGNQMLQSLVLNTGFDEHELGYDPVFGYGIVGLRHMLREDPTTFPDVNPLLLDVGEGEDVRRDEITLTQVSEATRPVWPGEPGWVLDDGPSPSSTATPSAEAVPDDPAEPAAPGRSVGVAVVTGAAVLVVALAAVAGVLVARRRARAAGDATPHPQPTLTP